MIVLVIRGGNLAESYDVPSPSKNFKNDEVWLVDWDNIECGDAAVRLDSIVVDSLPVECAEQIPGWPA